MVLTLRSAWIGPPPAAVVRRVLPGDPAARRRRRRARARAASHQRWRAARVTAKTAVLGYVSHHAFGPAASLSGRRVCAFAAGRPTRRGPGQCGLPSGCPTRITAGSRAEPRSEFGPRHIQGIRTSSIGLGCVSVAVLDGGGIARGLSRQECSAPQALAHEHEPDFFTDKERGL
jgi:hypothetical protein